MPENVDTGYISSVLSCEAGMAQYALVHEARFQNLKHIGRSVDIFPIRTFFDSIIPPVPDACVAGVVDRLKERNVLDRTTGSWTAFGPSPARQKSPESAVFLPIQCLVEQIHSATLETRAAMNLPERVPRYSYRSNAGQIPISLSALTNTPPGGFLIDNASAPGSLYWKNVGLVAQFKKNDSAEDLNDNVCKLVWGMKHCMLEDLRRSFVFGLTIENRAARVWYCDRSQMVVSEPFDFIRDTTPFVHLFVSLCFGDDRDLGLNPTISSIGAPACVEKGRAKIHRPWRYEYRLPTGRRFRTHGKPESVDEARSLIGRGTCVWNVKEVIVDSETNEEREDGDYILKDTWTDEDRRREGQVYEEILKLPLLESEHIVLEKALLKVVCYTDVTDGTWIDKTRDLSTEKAAVGRKYPLVKINEHVDADQTAQIESSSVVHQTFCQESLFKALPLLPDQRRKVHNITIFAESGTPLHTVTSLKTVVRAIHQVSAALFVLHKYGWLHCDISSSNILVCAGQNVKLIDLVSAKHKDDKDGHEIRTETSQFTPIEVQAERYIFKPHGDNPEDSVDSDEDVSWLSHRHNILSEARSRDTTPEPPAQEFDSEPVFTYNPIHDLESLAWVGITFLASRKVASQGNKRLAHDIAALRKQHKIAQAVPFDVGTRNSLIAFQGFFKSNIVAHLHPLVVPLGRAFDAIRATLVARYKEAEKDMDSQPIGFKATHGLHAKFNKLSWQVDLGSSDIIIEEFGAEELIDPNAYVRSKKPRAEDIDPAA